MEVDNDIEGQLLQQFSSMGTTDKDVLIGEFQRLIGSDLNPSLCTFFLDMNNWNLPAAIGSYYDYEQPSNMRVPVMSFIKDITIGEGESVPTSTNFIKTWRIQNTGADCWPPGCCLRFVGGEQFGACERVLVGALQPSALSDVSVNMCSPPTTGIFQGQWRMQTATGLYFGDMIWVILQVEEHGLLGLTQQLSNITSGEDQASQRPSENAPNPFLSPNKSNNAAVHTVPSTPPHNPFASPSDQSHHLGNPFISPSNHSSTQAAPNFQSNSMSDNSECMGIAEDKNSHLAVTQIVQSLIPGDNICSSRTDNAIVQSGLNVRIEDCGGNNPLTAVGTSSISSSWPGSTLLTHDMSHTAPTPHVSPHAGTAPATSPTLDLLEDMT